MKRDTSKRPLVLAGEQWQNIVRHLRPESDQKDQKRQEKDRAYDEYLKSGSRSMTRNWTNSVEKIRERENLEFLQAKERKRTEGKFR